MMHPNDLQILKQMTSWWRRNQSGTQQKRVHRPPQIRNASSKACKIIKAPSGGIPAIASDVLGSATCDVWADDGTDSDTIDDTGENITVYNWQPFAAFANGDRLGVAVWNGAYWIAAPSQRQIIKIGKTDSSVSPASTVTVSVWRNGSDTGENVTGVKYDWMDTSGAISSGKEVVIQYFADEDVWRITGADCE